MAAPAGGPKKMRSENPEFQNQQHERCVVFLSVSFWSVRSFTQNWRPEEDAQREPQVSEPAARMVCTLLT